MAASASGAPRNDDRAWVHVDIPGDFDPYCDRLLAPRSPAEGKLRCVVRLSADRRRDVCLHIEEGNIFLLAARKEAKRWLVGATPGVCRGSALMEMVPVHERGGTAYSCVRRRVGAGEVETMHVSHSTQLLAEDLPEVNAMSVALPVDAPAQPWHVAGSTATGSVDCRGAVHGGDVHGGALQRSALHGSREIHGGMNSGWAAAGSAPQGECAGGARALERSAGELRRKLDSILGGHEEHDVIIVQTKLPRWNPTTDSFELPFHGRANFASERNFQLVLSGSRGPAPTAQPVLVHGKLDDDTFSLDFAHPLSPLHAFGLALVTWGW